MRPKFKKARENMTPRELARCINELISEVERTLCFIDEDNLSPQLKDKITKEDKKHG